MNSRPLFNAQDISPYTRKGWTVLVRVLERHPATVSRGDASLIYRRYLLIDMQDVKISAVAYGADIGYFENFLLPMKKYYISNAGVRHMKAQYQTEGYKYSWTLSKSTLIEPFAEPEPSRLPVAFELKKFQELISYADLDIPITMKFLVLHAFLVESVASKSSTQDFVIINEEKIPMMLRMWKELHETDGVKIVAAFPKPTVVLAMNLKVATFHGLSLCTRYNTCFIHDPPEEGTEPLAKWYETNVEEVNQLLDDRVYRDVSGFIPVPKASSVMRISEAKDTIETIKTAWIAGKTTLIPALDRIVYTICSYCYKSLKADTEWAITCTHCGEDTKVKLRCHIELFISDGSGVLEAEMYSPYVEQLMGIPATDIYESQTNGKSIGTELEKAVENKQVVCFIKYFDKEFRGANKRKFIVVKMLPAAEVFGEAHDVNATIIDGTAAANPGANEGLEGLASEMQFFSPTTKLIIQDMIDEKNNSKGEAGQTSGVKRYLQFDEPSGEATMTSGEPPISALSGQMEMAANASHVAESPGKKNKPKEKQS